MEATLHELASHYEEGGSLVGGYFQGLAHQVPRGIDPMAGPIHALSVGSNGAHVGMTHFPALESEINKLVRMRGILFQKPWREGVGIPTSGGTASNNLSADLALSSAGSGLALKLACENMGVDLIVSWKGRGVDLKDLDATQALMIHPESLSGGVRQLEGKQREQLRKEFKAQLKSVQKQYPPLVAIPRGEWAHYTLERHLRAAAGDNLIRVPINANTEMDFEWLRGEIEQRFKDGPRPLIVPLTFCNTGLGRAGYDGKSLTQFVTWFANTYGAPPLGIVDAAQGSLLFGIHQKRLSNEILEAREMLGEFAMCMTLDPHKTSLPLPCSVWVVKDPSWAMFATGTSVEHSYLEASDAAELRESTQLSTPLESAMIAFKYFRNLRTGEHNDIFAPVLKSAENAYQSLQETVLHVTVSGREFRMIAPFEPHSGILGVCFVPVDGDMSMRAANEALMKVRELLVGDRGSSLSCSAYSLALSAFSSAALVKEKLLTPGVRWEGVEKVEFLRFVFGQGSQEGVVLEVLPKIISERFS
jgi:glutamate/tyrosine decarboxylase-like PLP-dependent enzyme